MALTFAGLLLWGVHDDGEDDNDDDDGDGSDVSGIDDAEKNRNKIVHVVS